MASDGQVGEVGRARVVNCGLNMSRIGNRQSKRRPTCKGEGPVCESIICLNHRTGLSCDSVMESKHIGHLAHLRVVVER